MMQCLQQRLQEALRACVAEMGWAGEPSISFDRQGLPRFICSTTMRQVDSEGAAQTLCGLWNKRFAAIALAEAVGGLASFACTQEALRQEMLRMGDLLGREEIPWEEATAEASVYLRLGADVALGIEGPFRAEDAMAVLAYRKGAGPLPMRREPFSKEIACALQTAIQERWKEKNR